MRWFSIVWMMTAAATLGLAATDSECSEILQRSLHSGNPETRTQAVVALSLAAVRGPLFNQLTEMLQDKDVEVRLAVVASLSDMKTASATASLKKALQDDIPEVSFAAAKALWARHDPAGREALLSVLEGESKTTSNFFSKQKREALRMMHTPRTTLLFALHQGVGAVHQPAKQPGFEEGPCADVSGR
jgi:HEAT repeat protein